VYKYLPNKEIRSANSLDVSQDFIKNQHKNKAKTKPIYKMLKMNVSSFMTSEYEEFSAFRAGKNKAKTKPIRLRLWLRRDRFKAKSWHGHLGRVFMGWKPMPHSLRMGQSQSGVVRDGVYPEHSRMGRDKFSG